MLRSTGIEFQSGICREFGSSVSGVAVTAADSFTGSACLEMDMTAAPLVYQTVTLAFLGEAGLDVKNVSRLTPLRIGFAFKILSAPDATHNIMEIRRSPADPFWRQLSINSARELLLANDGKAQIGASLGARTLNTWYAFCCDFWPWWPYYSRIWWRTAAGGWTSWLDESIISDSDCDAPLCVPDFVIFGNTNKAPPTAGAEYRYDDLSVEYPDALGSTGTNRGLWQGFQAGLIGHEILTPNADVTTQWASTGGNHFGEIDEVPASAPGTDYISETNPTQEDKHDVSGAAAGKTPKRLVLQSKGHNAGALNQENLRYILDDGGTVQEIHSAEDNVDDSAFQLGDDLPFESRPNGSVPWTEAAVNAVRQGVRTKNTGAGYDYRVEAMSIEQAYEEHAPPSVGASATNYKGFALNRPNVYG